MSEVDLKALFLRHGNAVRNLLLRRSRDPQLASDLTQESFLRLAEQARNGPVDNSPAYLFRIAQNLLIDHIRQQQRRRTDSQPNEAIAHIEDETPDLERQLAARQRLKKIREAVAELPPRTQQIFRLNRLQGLTYAEVARHLGISDSSVQKHLTRALQHVAERLRDD
ncbi:RNA polymerase sigma-70 factor, ECF subfamily, HasI [Pseudomonas sp. BAY1663]|uniref:RNA polymerase sigma factor n=1 Tax=Pseudomonas TaxID=286 RepID=UPI00042DF478|nr:MULTISPECIES: RNA polymerase sigma factor [Pseudomonas]EXF46630.1 RNA polymerase sigma-70 factor, ECF subfamily, HasI [Pseudomonas sp. BAY1663]MBE7373278.1 RNA polymerase sigma factor [Pseudomonas lopnurensis]